MFGDSCPRASSTSQLSGGDRKAQGKCVRHEHGLHESYFRESVLIRRAKIRDADRRECEAWNAINVGRATQRCRLPVNPKAEPKIAKAINGGYHLLEAKCNRCNRV